MNASDFSKYAAYDQLRDQRRVLIRAVHPNDKAVLQAGLQDWSDESSYHRFFRVKHFLSPQELIELTELDFVRHVGIVAELPDESPALPVGVARYIVTPSTSSLQQAEIAVSVTDDYQGCGVGTALLRQLVDIACQNNVNQLVANVLQDNTRMLRLLDHLALPARRVFRSGVFEITLDLPIN